MTTITSIFISQEEYNLKKERIKLMYQPHQLNDIEKHLLYVFKIKIIRNS